jgi:quercetin dioxygenase-like cupin family protein
MEYSQTKKSMTGLIVASLSSLAVGLAVGAAVQAAQAPPTKHKGVGVASLGVLPESSLQKQVGLNGYVLQMREITLAPGGHIAKHSHANRPGLVYTTSGSWIEGRADGEKEYPVTEKIAILEDAETEHWFFNRESEPTKVIVCDMVPPS